MTKKKKKKTRCWGKERRGDGCNTGPLYSSFGAWLGSYSFYGATPKGGCHANGRAASMIDPNARVGRDTAYRGVFGRRF